MLAWVLAGCGGQVLAAAGAVTLEPVWTRLADGAGRVDEEGGTASVESCEFSPDGRWVAAGSKGVLGADAVRRGQRVVLYEAESGREVWSRERADEVEAVSFSRCGRFVAAAGEDELAIVYSAPDGVEVARLASGASFDSLRFSPDGRWLAGGTEDGELRIYRVSNWTEALVQPFGVAGRYGVNSVDFSRDGRLLAAAGGWAMQGRVWEIETWRNERGEDAPSLRLRHVLEKHRGTMKSVRFSLSGERIALSGGVAVPTTVWDVGTGRVVAELPPTSPTVEAIEWTRDGRYLLTGGTEGKEAGRDEQMPTGYASRGGMGHIRVYAVAEGWGEVARVPVFRQEYLHFDQAGGRLVSGHEDGTVRMWRFTLPVGERAVD